MPLMFTLNVRFHLALPITLLVIAPACGSSTGKDAGPDDRPLWGLDVEPTLAPDAEIPDVTSSPGQSNDATEASDTATDTTVSPDIVAIDSSILEDALIATDSAVDYDPLDGGMDLPDPGFSYLCGDGYLCLTSCENRCGLHELGRSTCVCDSGVLHCGDCLLTDLARPQVPEVVTTICAAETTTDGLCSRPGDACYLHANSPYPDGCLCWPTPSGLVWNCGPVFGWFTTM